MKIKFNESRRKMFAFILPAMQTESPTATSTPSAKMPRLVVTTSAVFEDPLRSATTVFVLEFVHLMPLMKSWTGKSRSKLVSLQSLHSSVQCKMCQSQLVSPVWFETQHKNFRVPDPSHAGPHTKDKFSNWTSPSTHELHELQSFRVWWIQCIQHVLMQG